MSKPSSRIRLRFSPRIGAPPPVSTTIHAGVGRSDAMTRDSRSRKLSIPSCSMMSLFGLRARRAMARSVSTTLAPRRLARSGAMVLLPMPGGPTMKRCTRLFPLVDRTETRAIAVDRGDEIVGVIGAELLDERIGKNEREHRLRDDPCRRDDADVAALDVCRRRRTGAQVCGGQWLHQRRDRLESDLDNDVLAVAHSTLETTGAVAGKGGVARLPACRIRDPPSPPV